ncbi:receptor-like protein kinase FERONIA [Rutidosis leptorrhynchoides]|uniref:receptor-like protein kinase FERONIA n=1 Tax=Rutidosis leptorrhynchoides TaxID=125765 RepID=UPI003A9A495B
MSQLHIGDHLLLNCSSSTRSNSESNQTWDGDENSKFLPSDINKKTSFSSDASSSIQYPLVPTVPYLTARIFNATSFTYTFPVFRGPKFIRLYFYPATYSVFKPNQSFFSVSSNGYSLLTNFSPFLTSNYMNTTHFVKEFIIYVKDEQTLQLMFTPSANSYAFINGIEILSIPEDLYYKVTIIDYDTALENMYRLNIGGRQISPEDDTGMYRSWEQDNNYIYGGAYGWTPVYNYSIVYTTETPDFTAPEIVYRTQRSIGDQSERYNLTWILPVDSGFYYMLRFHFCNIKAEYSIEGEVVFSIFINNQTVENMADVGYWTDGTGYPVSMDYVVFVSDADGRKSNKDLWLALHPNNISSNYSDAYLNGLEVFKVIKGVILSIPPPLQSPTSSMKVNKKKVQPYAKIIGSVGGGLLLLSVILLIVFFLQRRVKPYSTTNDKSSLGRNFSNSPLSSNQCRLFSLTELKVATDEFNDSCVIGRGGFGKVYKGYMDNATTTVAIKRLSTSSKQGFNEFKTEIQLMSKLHHVHLVSLIGYCDDNGEMILVYDSMARGTL